MKTFFKEIWSKLEPGLASAIASWVQRLLIITLTSGVTYYQSHRIEQKKNDVQIEEIQGVVKQLIKGNMDGCH